MLKHLSAICLSLCLASVSLAGEPVAVQPRPMLVGEQLVAWEFANGVDKWSAGSVVAVAAEQGSLAIDSTGEDPNVFSPPIKAAGPLVVQLRARVGGAGSGEIFWTTDAAPEWSPKQSKSFRLKHDGQLHEYQVLIDTTDTVTRLRLDPGSAAGRIDVDWIRVSRGQLHPLEIVAIESDADSATVRVRNHNRDRLLVHVNDHSATIEPASEASFEIAGKADVPAQVLPLVVRTEGFPVVRLPVGLYNPDATHDWISLRSAGTLGLDVARDGSAARFWLDDQVVAVAAPLVRSGDAVPAMTLAKQEKTSVSFKGDAITLGIELLPDGASISIDGKQTVEGPVLRALGSLEQGLLAGVEYLGKGEQSSSMLDIETDDHWRVRPDPMAVTMPLMAAVTDRATAAMTWQDMALQPVFASPNVLDGTSDHRMALEGKTIAARLYIGPAQPLEQTIAWAVQQRGGLPELPAPPRSADQQRALLLQAFNRSVANESGWGHAAEARWERKPYADVASAIGRLSGTWPQTPALVSGGAHVRNDAAYFMTGRASQWLGERTGEARTLLAEQQPDGSFRYDGPLRRGHHENTASGYNAWRAAILLDFAWLTGDKASLDGGLRCLEYMKRFRTPRGAQTHELPLHTPDLLGSAYLVWAYARGYELTGKPEYLDAARKWALSGVPFVYQWGNQPTMRYATIPALGATQWVEPNWIGLPVQWCGLVYGYALTMLAPHDQTLDWKRLAQGILISAEQMQYPDGELAGCLPDFYLLREQRRGGPSVNPGALVSLQLALEGKVDSLAAATDGTYRVASPFPVTIDNGVARIEATAGAAYQVLVDGQRVVTVQSKGVDEVPLGEKASNAARWEPLPPMPVPNGGFAGGAIGDRLVVAGGTTWTDDVKQWLDGTWALDLKTSTWTQAGTMPSPIAYAAVASADGGAMILVGGTDGTSALKSIGRLTAALELEPLGELPSPLIYAAAATASDGVYVAGGGSDPSDFSKLTNAFRRVDPKSGRATERPPVPGAGRMLPAVAAAGEAVMVVGGATFDSSASKIANVADAWVYSVKTQQWRAVRPYPAARRGIVAVALDDNWIYLAGGYGAIAGKAEEGFSDEAYLYSLRDDRYHRAAPLPYAVAGPALIKQGNFLYVLGGEDRMKHRSDQVVRVRWRELIPGH